MAKIKPLGVFNIKMKIKYIFQNKIQILLKILRLLAMWKEMNEKNKNKSLNWVIFHKMALQISDSCHSGKGS